MSESSLVVIGNFDGVHRGHQAVLHTVARLSAERGLRPRMLTFDPHPAETLGRTPPPLLTTLARKRELVELACPGIDVVVRPFTREFASQTPEQFVDRVLVDELHTAVVMVGSNFRFGHQRSGDIDDLRRFGELRGFELVSEPLVSDAHGPWSSTRVRAHITAGEVRRAAEILGRPHMLSGTVTRGDQRGRLLGFPTCNIADAREALPAYGVYAVLVDREQGDAVRAFAKGVANIGVRPTVAGAEQQPLIEAHLFEVNEDLYGQRLRVHLVEQLRPEQRFDGLDALTAQIRRDEQQARAQLSTAQPDPSRGVWA